MVYIHILIKKIVPISECSKDEYMQELLDTEFGGKECPVSEKTEELIKRYGFSWDPLSIPGYLTFKPYATFMERQPNSMCGN